LCRSVYLLSASIERALNKKCYEIEEASTVFGDLKLQGGKLRGEISARKSLFPYQIDRTR
jgi:hypothetical protein